MVKYDVNVQRCKECKFEKTCEPRFVMKLTMSPGGLG